MSARCEWNPAEMKPAQSPDAEGDCTNAATISAGSSRNNWHLCASCAALPRFRAFKKRPLRAPTPKENQP